MKNPTLPLLPRLTPMGKAITSTAWIPDADPRYRYRLTRMWDIGKSMVTWVMLNPSTADAYVDDPTIKRVIAFSERWGYGGAEVVNLFAFRTSKPSELPRYLPTACGFENMTAICAALVNTAIVAWGAPTHRWLVPMVEQQVRHVRVLARDGYPLLMLGATAGGEPKHPMARGVHRVPDTADPMPWDPPARYR